MTRFGRRIEPITSPTPGGCTTNHATDAGLQASMVKSTREIDVSIFIIHLCLLQPDEQIIHMIDAHQQDESSQKNVIKYIK